MGTGGRNCDEIGMMDEMVIMGDCMFAIGSLLSQG